MTLMLDTNAVSGIADGHVALDPILRKAAEIALPVIVLGEYGYGIRHSRERRRYEVWLQDAVSEYKVLPVDEETAANHAILRTELNKSGTPIPSNDVWIAALCRQHSCALLSRDRHFDCVRGLKRISWE